MKNTLAILLLLTTFACGKNSSSGNETPVHNQDTTTTTETQNPLKYVELVSPENQVIRSSIAYTPAAQTQGLQNVRPSEFSDDEGKLFFYLSENTRSFWMPNTYFNLDIFYLDENLKIIDVVWNLPHYTGNTNSEIPRAPAIRSRHVLEMKAGSALSSKLKIGDSLQWKSPLSLEQTEIKIRQQLQ